MYWAQIAGMTKANPLASKAGAYKEGVTGPPGVWGRGGRAVTQGLVHPSVSDIGLGISGRQTSDSKRFIPEASLPGSEQVLSIHLWN